MRSSRKKRPGAWIGIVLASSFLLVGAMKMSAYAEPAESTETAEITESSTGAGLSDMDFGMGDGQIELDPYDQVSDFIQHTTIDLKIKDMVKWKTEQNGCRIDVNSNIVEF